MFLERLTSALQSSRKVKIIEKKNSNSKESIKCTTYKAHENDSLQSLVNFYIFLLIFKNVNLKL